MSTNSENPLNIRPPKGLSKSEKTSFRDGIRRYFEGFEAISQWEIDALVDLIRAQSRVEALQKMLNAEVQEMRENFRPYSVDLIAVCRQLDSSTRLAAKLADRLKRAPL
ncbi:hypothetical protein [Mesorhizobium sp. L2C067A000]|uniref:hypothetical protein n=1 Tax=Mesorhizobium sp. L2C067A000 TaxID=1287106 RepID=UPI0003D06E6F|nr:hypothetical protein [Mesorhizobium sp. L2C067A000]ESZ29628.1 hypothetical protein X733_25000 [Mesorhizobium sp. L2C067A000]